MTFKHGDHATFRGPAINVRNMQIEELVVIDEVLDDRQYAVRFLNENEVFTVQESELTA
jgi:hypothetical protein